MKDFYDIYYLAMTFEFDGRNLQEAVDKTLMNRDRSYDQDSITDILQLANDLEVQKRWTNFCNKVLRYQLDLKEVISTIIDFVEPLFAAMINEKDFSGNWSFENRKYI